MSKRSNHVAQAGDMNSQKVVEMVADRVFAAADTHSVYGEPVTSGNYTLITASEVGSGGGGGGGGGYGPNAQTPMPEGSPNEPQQPESMVGGSGVGIGGGAFGRPVAVIIIGADGVKVKPVFDVTKIGIAFATTFGAMLLILGRVRKAQRA